MSIYLDRMSRVIVQGITGRIAQFHAKEMIDYGTNVVGGVVPGKGGETVHGVPVFNTVKEAVEPRLAPIPASSSCRRPSRRTASWKRPMAASGMRSA